MWLMAWEDNFCVVCDSRNPVPGIVCHLLTKRFGRGLLWRLSRRTCGVFIFFHGILSHNNLDYFKWGIRLKLASFLLTWVDKWHELFNKINTWCWSQTKGEFQGTTTVYCLIRCLGLRNTVEMSRVTLKYYIGSLNTEIWTSGHRNILIKTRSPGCLVSDNFLIELIPILKVWWELWQPIASEILLWVEDRNFSAAT